MTTKTSRPMPDPNLEKQMGGCMAGFFNLFDRHHLLSAKRLHPKRLPPPPPPPPSPGPPTVNDSPSKPQEQQPQPQQQQPEIRLKETASVPAPAPAPTAELPTKSPWKFSREAPRLSLDSRAITDGNGGLRPREIRINTGNIIDDDEGETQRRSPSVIARLMGLEPIPSSSSTSSETEPVKKVELRRSASESRSRDYRFVEPASFLTPVAGERKVIKKQPINKNIIKTNTNINININNNANPKARNSYQFINNNHSNCSNNYNNQRRLMLERRSYYDTADFYPPEIMMKKQHQQQLQHQPITMYGEIERKLRLKGIDEPSKDLETLKNLLEALQLKGLLHSSTTANTATKNRHNVVYDRTPANRRRNCQVSVASGEPSVSPRRERPVRTGRGENRSSSPVLRRKGSSLSIETTATGSVAAKRSSNSPVRSPRVARRTDQTVSKSPRGRRSSVEANQGVRVRTGQIFAEDEVSTISESSFSTSSHTDNERWRVEEYRDGRNLLERCDKLLNSIAEITASNCSNSNSNSAELQQPSPVSVLDSSFYKEDDSSPSPVKKRTIHFKDQAATELEDDQWSPASSTRLLTADNDIYSSDDFEFNYISEVIRASNYFPDDNNLFFMLEKQISIRGSGGNNSKTSILQRKLLFDTITEILDRNQHIPPWKAISSPVKRPMSEQIFSEFQKIREPNLSEDLFEVICGVLKKDMAEDLTTGWAGCSVEMSEAVLDIERLVFKDLIGEIIRDLAVLAGKNVGVQAPRRKLVF